MRTGAGWTPATRLPSWRRTWRADLAIPAFVAVVEIIGTHFAGAHQADHRPLSALAFGLVAAGAVALVARRRYPVPVLGVVFAATLTYSLIGYPDGPIFLSLIVAFFGAAARGYRRTAWLAGGIGFLCFSFLGDLIGQQPAADGFPGGPAGLAAWIIALAVAAEVTRVRRERATQAERAGAEEARRRASEERLRIARELHDVLGHDLSLISIQAGVGLDLMDERPEQARIALAAIKQASKDALGELRWVLDVLHRAEDEPPRSPTPGLDRLDDLVARSASAGINVVRQVEGRPRKLPTGVELAAFRIVQEALTNVGRHAGPATATVRVGYGARELTVEVVDDGRGAPPYGAPVGGNGIPGMTERATALGGQLTAGPCPGGGFRVSAHLPVQDSR